MRKKLWYIFNGMFLLFLFVTFSNINNPNVVYISVNLGWLFFALGMINTNWISKEIKKMDYAYKKLDKFLEKKKVKF